MKQTQTIGLVAALLILLAFPVYSQITVKGTVVDAGNNDPLIGASILVNESGEGTITDFDGNFQLKYKDQSPFSMIVSYTGYEDQTIEVRESQKDLTIRMTETAITVAGVEVVGQRVSEKQRANPLTVESLDLLAIKETASDNFYDGLGALKGVDLTAASIGFKIVNTRGFNSTSPVRSLQLIDGVDNQAPGLNFSLGNFLGSSELDVLKVDMVQGASSAFYGPNAFNGVIAMETKSPFFHKGLSASLKGGERNLLQGEARWADAIQNKDGDDVFGYKLNFSYLRADDWEADNFDPVFETETGIGNPGRYDAVNIYGDEYSSNMDRTTAVPWLTPRAMGQWHRTGYRESDLVNYDTRNLKTNAAFHFRLNPEEKEESVELILGGNYCIGTTVYQGDNRFSLNDIQFWQTKAEIRKKDKFFFRAYRTQDDAGNSYDPYFTALQLQGNSKNQVEWVKDYINYWQDNVDPQIVELGYPEIEIDIVDGMPVISFDQEGADNWLATYQDSLTIWHSMAETFANQAGAAGSGSVDFFEPGTERFDEEFDRITSAKSNTLEDGTRFVDRSALTHIQGEYTFRPEFLEYFKVGASGRRYSPESEGTIFYDTADVKITNSEFGFYAGGELKIADQLTANATLRLDKNENFDWLSSPALSLVWKPRANNFLRVSFSSAIRNPTLSDQYLNLNVGRATLAGNLDGVENLITAESFQEYLDDPNLDIGLLDSFDIAGVRPEQVKTFEIGYRTTLFNSLYVDAGYYYSIYNDFLGFNLGVDAEFGNNGRPVNLDVFRYSANSTNEVTTQGFSIGLNYYFGDYYQVAGNYSWNRLNKELEDDPIIPAFNTPEHKFNLSISGRNIQAGNFKNFGFKVNYKWIEGFLFEGSPQFTGLIPSYDLLDVQLNYLFPRLNLTMKVGASNLLDNQQFQTYGGPRIGRLAYVSFLYEFKKK